MQKIIIIRNLTLTVCRY